MTRIVLEESKIENTEKIERKLRVLTVKNRSYRKRSDCGGEKDARKIITKTVKEIEGFKAEIKRIKKSKKDIIKYKTSNLLYHLIYDDNNNNNNNNNLF